jgi:hypothetical protein
VATPRLNALYEQLKRIATTELGHDNVARAICDIAAHARVMLRDVDRIDLRSRVAGKDYFSFRGPFQSRPLNSALYAAEDGEFAALSELFTDGLRDVNPDRIVRTVYTLAYSVFAANDVFGIGRKTSATAFEVIVGHVVARAVGIAPRKKVRIPESGAELPTDYVFDPGAQRRKIHLPVKTSTRERAVQAWVHQLVLDRIFGNGVYRGVLVVASETKRNTRTGEVIEICVPRQLQMFQARVAEVSRVYYLDPPQVYLALANDFPRVEVRSFGTALAELDELLRL